MNRLFIVALLICGTVVLANNRDHDDAMGGDPYYRNPYYPYQDPSYEGVPNYNPTPWGNNPVANPCQRGYIPAYYAPNLYTCIYGGR